MRTIDVDTSGKVWIYTPESHETEHLDHLRRIFNGPAAWEILRPWLRPGLTAYLFQPRGAVAEHRAERGGTGRLASNPPGRSGGSGIRSDGSATATRRRRPAEDHLHRVGALYVPRGAPAILRGRHGGAFGRPDRDHAGHAATGDPGPDGIPAEEGRREGRGAAQPHDQQPASPGTTGRRLRVEISTRTTWRHGRRRPAEPTGSTRPRRSTQIQPITNHVRIRRESGGPRINNIDSARGRRRAACAAGQIEGGRP